MGQDDDEENVDNYEPQMGGGADFGGVEFTPMSGVNYTPNMSGADFGANADYGILPEGMGGEGQMG
jgi:hypothetical protein